MRAGSARTDLIPLNCLICICLLWLCRMAKAGSFDTIFNADAVEFCPIVGRRNLVIGGTYQLVEGEEGGRVEQQTRLGKLWVLKVPAGEDALERGEESAPPKLSLRVAGDEACCSLVEGLLLGVLGVLRAFLRPPGGCG